MSSYENGFERQDIEVLPGCAFFQLEGDVEMCLGFTLEGSLMTVEQGLMEIKADEIGETPLDHYHGGVRARVDIILLETSLAEIVKIIPTASLKSGRLCFGDVPGGKASVGKFWHRPFAYPDGSRDIVLHRATNTSDFTELHKHNQENRVTCSFVGTADLTKDDGDLVASVGQ